MSFDTEPVFNIGIVVRDF